MRIADPDGRQPGGRHLRARSSGFARVRRAARGAARGRPGVRGAAHRRAVRARPAASRACACSTPHELEIVLDEPYPQILYWFAMPFTAPVPWEAVAYYDGEDGRDVFAEHPVGTGPVPARALRQAQPHRARAQPELVRRPRIPSGARRPRSIPRRASPATRRTGCLDPAYVGRPLPFLDRVEFRLEKEDIPAFTKFLQGYYDASGIIAGELRPRRAGRRALAGDGGARHAAREDRRRRRLLPRLQHGRPGGRRAGRRARPQAAPGDEPRDRRRRVHCASSTNGRGIPAQSPLPPGIFGYDADYRNPVPPGRSRARAQRCSREAGYRGRHRSRDRQAAAPHLRHRRHQRARRCSASSSSSTPGSASGSTSRSPPPPTTSSRTRCGAAPTRSSCGAGSPTTPIPRTSSSCSGAPMGARAERRPQHRELRRPALRRALRRACGTRRRRRRARCALIREMRAHPRARAPLDRALPPRGLRALPRLGAQREAARAVVPDRQVRRRRPRAARASGAPRGTSRCAGRPTLLAALALAVVAPGDRRPACGSGMMLAYLVRRIAYGVVDACSACCSAVRALLPRRHARRHRAPGARREGAARGDRAVDREPRLRQAARLESRSTRSTRCSPSTSGAC